MEELTKLPNWSRCPVHQTLVLDGLVCTLCYAEDHPRTGDPLSRGALGKLRGERIEHDGIAAIVQPHRKL